jgi:hypothetical protein
MGVKVAALRHAPQESPQFGVIVAHRLESGAGDDGVELARHHGNANRDNDGRQEEDGEENATCHGPTPAALYVRARLGCAQRKWKQA